LIEQAALRLAQLREAGIEVPDEAAAASNQGNAPTAAAAVPSAHPWPPEPVAAPPSATPVSRLVHVDVAALDQAGFVTPASPRSALGDQFRVLKRPLIANAVGRGAAALNHGNLIMVTSALAGEGKTYTAVNLAMSIAAELDHTVMLVDADVARPSVLNTLGLPAGPGLLEVLEGKATLPEVLLRTDVDKLTVLPAGSQHKRATELLASEAMNSLLDDMATRYSDRIIIFDSPPLLLTTEARALATHMGQIVMVVQAGRTLQADVQHALSTIEACPVRLMVLNKARTEGPGGYGYGAYGYRYGYGRNESTTAPTEAQASLA
jgi:exopolysaccharide/PEP-CTERM locus tyrosine autokinase